MQIYKAFIREYGIPDTIIGKVKLQIFLGIWLDGSGDRCIVYQRPDLPLSGELGWRSGIFYRGDYGAGC